MSFILLGILNSQAAGAVAAGDYELLETTVLTADATGFQFTNTDTLTDYKHLQIRMTVHSDRTTTGDPVVMTFNDNRNFGVDYKGHRLVGNGSSVTSGNTGNIYLEEIATDQNGRTNEFSTYVIDLLDFFDTSKNMTARVLGGVAGTDKKIIGLFSGLFIKTATPTSIDFELTTNFTAGSRFSLYGIKTGA